MLDKFNSALPIIFAALLVYWIKDFNASYSLWLALATLISAIAWSWLNIFAYEEVKFDCTWEIESPPNRLKTITDRIDLKIYKLGKIVGEGEALKGKYAIQGCKNHFTISLTFNGVGKHSNTLAGVVLIKLEPEYKDMKGVWAQLSTSSDLLQGKVLLTKKTS